MLQEQALDEFESYFYGQPCKFDLRKRGLHVSGERSTRRDRIDVDVSMYNEELHRQLEDVLDSYFVCYYDEESGVLLCAPKSERDNFFDSYMQGPVSRPYDVHHVKIFPTGFRQDREVLYEWAIRALLKVFVRQFPLSHIPSPDRNPPARGQAWWARREHSPRSAAPAAGGRRRK